MRQVQSPFPQENSIIPTQAPGNLLRQQRATFPRRGYLAPPGHPRHKRVQGIVGALLYYAHDVDNKLLFCLSAIGAQQASATQQTNEAIDQILDYCATYPADGILYRSSDMVLCAHSDAGFHNESKGRSRAGEHIFRIATISCAVMNIAPSSASEAEDMTNLIIFASVSTGTFQRGMASFSERKICAPALLRTFLSL